MSAPRILVVDDESDIRATLREVLSDEGYEVDVAGDAAAATEAVQDASRKLDKAASKGVIHANQAANRKSSLASRAAAI